MILQDVRYAMRQMRRAPGFAMTVVLTLALGVGVATAVFCVIDAVILRPLPYRASGSDCRDRHAQPERIPATRIVARATRTSARRRIRLRRWPALSTTFNSRWKRRQMGRCCWTA